MFELIRRFKKYPIFRIWQVNNRMRKANLHINELFLFLDLDNTVYLFSEYGKTKEALEKSKRKGYYTKIPIFPGAAAFIKFLFTLCPNIFILSKCERDSAVEEKIHSIGRDMPFFPKDHIIIIDMNTSKADVIRSICGENQAVIVDDYHEIIIDAYNEGFVGIKKTYSGKIRPVYQIREFYELLFILKLKLNISFDLTGRMEIEEE